MEVNGEGCRLEAVAAATSPRTDVVDFVVVLAVRSVDLAAGQVAESGRGLLTPSLSVFRRSRGS